MNRFTIFVGLFCALALRADDWPQWLGPKRDGVWREDRILEKFSSEGPKIRWRTPVGAGYSGPAVAQGRVFLTDRLLSPDAKSQANPFDRGQINGRERVLCLSEATGKILWSHEYDCPYSISYAAGPRANPIVSGNKVYTLGAEGNLICLDTGNGQVIWQMDFNEAFGIPTPLWGFSAHPLIDGNRLICLAGGDGSTVVAFDKETGKELWRALSAKEPGYAPPMIYEAQGKRQLIVWHPEGLNGLNPQTGEVYWTEPFPTQSALTIPTPRMWGENHLFLTAFYNGSRLLQFTENGAGVTTVWKTRKPSEKDTEYLHSIISTPFIEGDYVYGVCSYGQLRCVNLKTPERAWATMAATTHDGKEARWANAFLIKQGDRFFIPNEQGDLIIARLSPKGYDEVSRAHILEPTNTAAGRDVLWSHPAFANRSAFMRNDRELVCVDLSRPSR